MSKDEDLAERKAAALNLLTGDTSPKGKSLRLEIEGIDPRDASRRDQTRLEALCRKVGEYHAGLPKKQFNRQPTFDRTRAHSQNHRGSRSRTS